MASQKQEILGRYLDQLRGDVVSGPFVPKWWHDSGDPASTDEILHEIRDRFGIYAMQKKLRYDVNQASLKAPDSKTREKLINLRYLIDKGNLTKQEGEQVSKLYDALKRNSSFNQELESMMQSIRYE